MRFWKPRKRRIIVRVNLHFQNEMVGVLLDRFGKDISIYRTDKEGWSETYVDVALSDQFLGLQQMRKVYVEREGYKVM